MTIGGEIDAYPRPQRVPHKKGPFRRTYQTNHIRLSTNCGKSTGGREKPCLKKGRETFNDTLEAICFHTGANELYKLLSYSIWQKFQKPMEEAKIAYKKSGPAVHEIGPSHTARPLTTVLNRAHSLLSFSYVKGVNMMFTPLKEVYVER